MVAREDVVQEVRELVKGEKQLDCPTTDEFLLRFIRASNYDVKLSFKLVKDYYKARHDHPEEFVFGPASNYFKVISTIDLGYANKHQDRHGRRILVLRLGGVDPFTQEWEFMLQTAALVLEACSLDPVTQESGCILIGDCTDFSLRLMKWATPHKLKIMMKFLQDSIPIRFEVIHIVNAPAIFSMFWTALKPFMSDKFVEKVSWHKAPFTKLHSSIDPAYLPPWMGGTLDPESVMDWHKEITAKEDLLREYAKYGYQKTPR